MTTVSISLPEKIAREVDSKAKEQGFATRSEFIRNLLRQYLSSGAKFEEFKEIPIAELKIELARTGKYSEKFINSVIKGFNKSSLYAK